MSIQARINKLEDAAAPIREVIREREERLQSFRQIIAEDSETTSYSLRIYEYIGHETTRGQVESDELENLMLASAEYEARFRVLFTHNEELHQERVRECIRWANIRLALEYYGVRSNMENQLRSEALTDQLESDMRAGLPASESEAARTFKSFYDTYPRIRYHSESLRHYMAGGELEPINESEEES
jgi:hypothetical protein